MQMFQDKTRILIAAGGTGGHLLPALEVAKKLESLPQIPKGRLRIEFVGVGRDIERTILKNEGFVSHVVPGLGLRGKGWKGARDFIKISPRAYFLTKQLIQSFKPNVVAGFGGYPSVLPVLVARLHGIPTWIHEADSSIGWATKFLATFATKISSGFENLELPFGRQAIFTGHPVREGIGCCPVPQLGFRPRNILVLGGSQAAKALDLALPGVINELRNPELEIVHQARAENCQSVLNNYRNYGILAEVKSFISDMPEVLAKSDLIISRSGAGAVTELSILNKPVIFIPLPKVSGPQLHNAKTMQSHGKALIVEEGNNFEIRLKDAIAHLLQPEEYRAMMLQPFANRRLSAAKSIAEGIFELAGGK